MNKIKRTLAIRIDDADIERLKKLAKEEHRSYTELARIFIKDGIKGMEGKNVTEQAQ